MGGKDSGWWEEGEGNIREGRWRVAPWARGEGGRRPWGRGLSPSFKGGGRPCAAHRSNNLLTDKL